MLGNGRPFVIEVLEAKEPPSREVMQEALDFISSGSGLNVDNDVDVLILEEVRRQTAEVERHVLVLCSFVFCF
jgi:tRNA U54 and U55 pseudouridine synthase Pus10